MRRFIVDVFFSWSFRIQGLCRPALLLCHGISERPPLISQVFLVVSRIATDFNPKHLNPKSYIPRSCLSLTLVRLYEVEDLRLRVKGLEAGKLEHHYPRALKVKYRESQD